VLLNLRGEPRATAPLIRTNISESPVQPKIITIKSTEESTSQKPVVVVKKKPVVVPKPPTPTKESRPPKVKLSFPITLSLFVFQPSAPVISVAAPRLAPSRNKPTTTITSSSNGKVTSSKIRPTTAPTSKSTTTTINNTQSRTQRIVPIILPSTTKTRPKPPVSTNRRSSFGATLPSNLQRQSTSTGGSTSSLSSTNTQASIPCTHSETGTTSILRSVSNDIISTPNALNINTKSRIPIRKIAIPIVKKSST